MKKKIILWDKITTLEDLKAVTILILGESLGTGLLSETVLVRDKRPPEQRLADISHLLVDE